MVVPFAREVGVYIDVIVDVGVSISLLPVWSKMLPIPKTFRPSGGPPLPRYCMITASLSEIFLVERCPCLTENTIGVTTATISSDAWYVLHVQAFPQGLASW